MAGVAPGPIPAGPVGRGPRRGPADRLRRAAPPPRHQRPSGGAGVPAGRRDRPGAGPAQRPLGSRRAAARYHDPDDPGRAPPRRWCPCSSSGWASARRPRWPSSPWRRLPALPQHAARPATARPAPDRAGEVHGLGRMALLRRIVLPGALPSILVGVRYGLGVMWLTLIVAETISADSGIGYLAMNAREFLQSDVWCSRSSSTPCSASSRTRRPCCSSGPLPWHPRLGIRGLVERSREHVAACGWRFRGLCHNYGDRAVRGAGPGGAGRRDPGGRGAERDRQDDAAADAAGLEARPAGPSSRTASPISGPNRSGPPHVPGRAAAALGAGRGQRRASACRRRCAAGRVGVGAGRPARWARDWPSTLSGGQRRRSRWRAAWPPRRACSCSTSRSAPRRPDADRDAGPDRTDLVCGRLHHDPGDPPRRAGRDPATASWPSTGRGSPSKSPSRCRGPPPRRPAFVALSPERSCPRPRRPTFDP